MKSVILKVEDDVRTGLSLEVRLIGSDGKRRSLIGGSGFRIFESANLGLLKV